MRQIQIDLAPKTRKQMRRETATQVPVFCLQRKMRHGWETEAVFYSQEEAEDAGEANTHNYGKKNVGWRTWCCPAYGYLRILLNKIETEEDKATMADPLGDALNSGDGVYRP